jgi:phage gpG-like protein
VIFFVEALGIRQVQTKFTRMSEAAIDASPVMETLADTMMAIIATIFESQGRRGGGSWKRDSPEWLARKVRMGLDPRINFAGGDLFASMTEPGDPNQILNITPQSVSIGSALEYAEVSNENRPFTKFTQRDKAVMRAEVRSYLMAAWRHGLRPK